MNKHWTITRKKFLSITEIRKLRKTTEDAYLLAEKKGQMLAIRDWMIIDLALSTGIRVSEMSKLKAEDLYLKNNESEIIVVNGKGGKSRMVKIDPSLKRHLKKYLQWKRSIDKNGNYVFFSDRRDRMCVESFEKVFNKYSKKAGISNEYTFHSMRHSYATHLYAKTLDLRLVQKQLGHSSPAITQIYADIVNSNLNKAFSSPLFD